LGRDVGDTRGEVEVKLGFTSGEEKGRDANPGAEGKAEKQFRFQRRKDVRSAIAVALAGEEAAAHLGNKGDLKGAEEAARRRWRKPQGGEDVAEVRKIKKHHGSQAEKVGRAEWLEQAAAKGATQEELANMAETKVGVLRRRAKLGLKSLEVEEQESFITTVETEDMYGISQRRSISLDRRPPTPPSPSQTVGRSMDAPAPTRGQKPGPNFSLLASEQRPGERSSGKGKEVPPSPSSPQCPAATRAEHYAWLLEAHTGGVGSFSAWRTTGNESRHDSPLATKCDTEQTEQRGTRGGAGQCQGVGCRIHGCFNSKGSAQNLRDG
jgi:hypothetical protein